MPNWTPAARWLDGLVGGFIGGGAGAVTSTFAAGVLAPDKFNAGAQWRSLLALMSITFALNGIIGAALYLKQHPTPDWDGTTERRADRPLGQ